MVEIHTNLIVISNLKETIRTFTILSIFYILIECLVFKKKNWYHDLIYSIVIYMTHLIYLYLLYIFQTKIKQQNYTKIGNLIILIQILLTIVFIIMQYYQYNFISEGILYTTLFFQLISLIILRLCYSVLKKISYELINV